MCLIHIFKSAKINIDFNSRLYSSGHLQQFSHLNISCPSMQCDERGCSSDPLNAQPAT